MLISMIVVSAFVLIVIGLLFGDHNKEKEMAKEKGRRYPDLGPAVGVTQNMVAEAPQVPRQLTLLEKEYLLLEETQQELTALPVKCMREQKELMDAIEQHRVNIDFFKANPAGESVFGQLLGRINDDFNR